jgi:hypothetical protein
MQITINGCYLQLYELALTNIFVKQLKYEK